jgi:hypothetical protein
MDGEGWLLLPVLVRGRACTCTCTGTCACCLPSLALGSHLRLPRGPCAAAGRGRGQKLLPFWISLLGRSCTNAWHLPSFHHCECFIKTQRPQAMPAQAASGPATIALASCAHTRTRTRIAPPTRPCRARASTVFDLTPPSSPLFIAALPPPFLLCH